MDDIVENLDELLLLCEGAAAQAQDPKVANAMRRAIGLIQQARALLQAEGSRLQFSLGTADNPPFRMLGQRNAKKNHSM
jgi:hypothetical protein